MKKTVLSSLLLILVLFAYGQTFNQKGVVVDNAGEPLIGVSVLLKGTINGAITDLDGNFSINVLHNSILEFAYVGYNRKEYRTDSLKHFVKIVLEEDALILEDVVVSAMGYSKSDYSSPDSDKVGLLTAGEVNDFSKWIMWDSIANNDFSSQMKAWQIRPLERYVGQVMNEDNMPIVDAVAILKDQNDNIIWQSRTDNTGRAELWTNIYEGESYKSPYYISFQYNDVDTTVKAFPFSEGINTVNLHVSCNQRKEVDIMMIVDATGSMGDEITYLQNELHDIINKTKWDLKLDMRVGSVFYRDRGDEYLTRKYSLDSKIKNTINFIRSQSAGGGGDYPEAVDEALYQSIEMENWRENALARIAFLVLDAPAHTNDESIAKMQQQIKLAAQKGIRIVPIVCSGMDKNGEYLLRSFALATNGTYVFLTDDSGIGGSHLKPTTDKYEVEILNDVIIRLITQYTRMPDCNNDKWMKKFKKDQVADNFVPNPYDEDPEEKSDKIKLKDVMKVYPNPCKGMLNIDINREISELYIVDISGKYLGRYTPAVGDMLNIDMSGYSAGIYFVKAYCQGRWFTEKLIVR